jgi:hypothetical protein
MLPPPPSKKYFWQLCICAVKSAVAIYIYKNVTPFVGRLLMIANLGK